MYTSSTAQARSPFPKGEGIESFRFSIVEGDARIAPYPRVSLHTFSVVLTFHTRFAIITLQESSYFYGAVSTWVYSSGCAPFCFFKNGLSIRQISRLTGVAKKIVEVNI